LNQRDRYRSARLLAVALLACGTMGTTGCPDDQNSMNGLSSLAGQNSTYGQSQTFDPYSSQGTYGTQGSGMYGSQPTSGATTGMYGGQGPGMYGIQGQRGGPSGMYGTHGQTGGPSGMYPGTGTGQETYASASRQGCRLQDSMGGGGSQGGPMYGRDMRYGGDYRSAMNQGYGGGSQGGQCCARGCGRCRGQTGPHQPQVARRQPGTGQ
jgi:hypothetical protein